MSKIQIDSLSKSVDSLIFRNNFRLRMSITAVEGHLFLAILKENLDVPEADKLSFRHRASQHDTRVSVMSW